MIRKQLYLEETQDRALKRRARELGVSEAELVRRALTDALKPSLKAKKGQESLLKDLFSDADKIAKKYSFGNYHFDRQALAEEDPRQSRW